MMSFIKSDLGRLVPSPAAQCHANGHSGTKTLITTIRNYDNSKWQQEQTIRIPASGRITGQNGSNGKYNGQSASLNMSNTRLVVMSPPTSISSDKADAHSLRCGQGVNDAQVEVSGVKGPTFLHKDPALLVELEQYLPKPIHMWTEKDCESWMTFISLKRGLGNKILDVISAIPLSGIDLLRWSLSDFSRLFGPSDGLQIVEELVRRERELELLATGGSGAYIQRSDATVTSSEINTMTRSQPMKVWEFLAVLLAIPAYNPTFIQWVKEEEGLFTMTNTLEIIKLWSRTVATSSLPKQIAHGNSPHDVNVGEENLKLKLSEKAYLLCEHFLGHLREDCRVGLIFKLDGDKYTYRLGHQALQLHQELKNV